MSRACGWHQRPLRPSQPFPVDSRPFFVAQHEASLTCICPNRQIPQTRVGVSPSLPHSTGFPVQVLILRVPALDRSRPGNAGVLSPQAADRNPCVPGAWWPRAEVPAGAWCVPGQPESDPPLLIPPLKAAGSLHWPKVKEKVAPCRPAPPRPTANPCGPSSPPPAASPPV